MRSCCDVQTLVDMAAAAMIGDICGLRVSSAKCFAPASFQCGCVQVWFFNDIGRRWEQEPSSMTAHSDWVRDVAWAPNMGLPLNTIASAGQVSSTKWA